MLLSLLPAISSGISGYPIQTENEVLDESKSLIFESSSSIDASSEIDGDLVSLDLDSHLQIRVFLAEPELDPLPIEAYDTGLSMKEAQALLRERREYVESEVRSNNEARLREIEIATGIEGFEANRYASLLTYDLPDGEELNGEFAASLEAVLNASPEIEEIFVSEISSKEETGDTYLPFETVFEYVNLSSVIESGEYSGRGVTVGIADEGVLDVASYSGNDPSCDDFTGRNITIRSDQDTLSNHANVVAMIAVGNNGVARGSDILSCTWDGGAETYLSWMIQNGANIVNASFGLAGESISGTYTSETMIADQLTKDYLLTVAAAAGNFKNNQEYTRYIITPSTAFNYITVGNSANSTETLWESSAYKEADGYTGSKPTLTAPGSIITNAGQNTGTSGASPLVAGCLALLMEEYPVLMLHPELCSSIVTSSASPMSEDYNETSGDSYYDGSGLHNQIGAGLLNYGKMREAAANMLTAEIPADSPGGLIDEGIEIVAREGQRIRASGAWLARGADTANFTNYDLRLYKVGFGGEKELVSYISDIGNNLEFIDFEVKTSGTYWLTLYHSFSTYLDDPVALSYVLLDPGVGGSTSGARGSDKTASSHADIATDEYSSFGSTYNSEAETETVYDSNGHAVTLNRLRSRYTSDGQFVLSAKSNDADEAYAEYWFDGYAVYDFHYEFGLWSDSENLILNSSIDLYGLIQGDWVLIRHFDPKEMTTDPDNPGFYIETLDVPAEGVRFQVTTNKTNNSNNVGRVVIGEIGGNTHVHSYTESYEQFDDYRHVAYCACGWFTYENHVWGGTDDSRVMDYTYCTRCNEEHNLTTGGPVATPFV